MKFLNVRDLRNQTSKVWSDLSEEGEIVVTNNGRPVAILTAVNESNLEESLAAIRQARAIEAVTRIQRKSVEQGRDKTTLAEINKEIAATRKKRRS
jgi:antitoxin (DNA-binding transcriptional repressor) of toxin-antitoxin stability system